MIADPAQPKGAPDESDALDRALWLLGYLARSAGGQRWIDVGSSAVRLGIRDGELEIFALWDGRSVAARWRAALPRGYATESVAQEIVALAGHLHACEQTDVLEPPSDWVERRLTALLHLHADIGGDFGLRAQLAFRCWRDDPSRATAFESSWQLRAAIEWHQTEMETDSFNHPLL